MKYIRTKYKIVLPKNELSLKRILASSSKYIVKSADTIEELCDAFVVFDSNNKPQIYDVFDLKLWTIETKLYGAIWTEKV